MKRLTSRTPWLFPLLLLAASSLARGQDETEEAVYEFLDEADVRTALEETLSQPEFARLRAEPEEEEEETKSPEWLDRFFSWLGDLFGNAEAAESSELSVAIPGVELLLYGMAALILGVAVVFIVKSVLAVSRDKKVDGETDAGNRVFQAGAAPGEVAPDDYWRRALEHGEKRRFKDGIRELLLGAMSATERRGLIRFRRGLTNRDYFYSVRGPARDSFALIASAFEHVYFGRRDASPDAFRECCREYQKSFREASA